jgi:hypothetical protein
MPLADLSGGLGTFAEATAIVLEGWANGVRKRDVEGCCDASNHGEWR